jgi:hypothetical protein
LGTPPAPAGIAGIAGKRANCIAGNLPSFDVFKPGLLRSKLARALKAEDFKWTW